MDDATKYISHMLIGRLSDPTDVKLRSALLTRS